MLSQGSNGADGRTRDGEEERVEDAALQRHGAAPVDPVGDEEQRDDDERCHRVKHRSDAMRVRMWVR